MTRKPINPNAQAIVLTHSRRRCCICFGLNRNTLLVQGQIAHLDQNPENNSEDNLAFLCFDHHDQFDSRTRQSKNFTIEEVKHYRQELHQAIKIAFSIPVSFGDAKADLSDVSGHYIRTNENDSAEFKIQRLPSGEYHISGLAFWGINREFGPNTGDLEFISSLENDLIAYRDMSGHLSYTLVLRFSEDQLIATEDNALGMFGMNVEFTGNYQRAT
jgi:hypothetical protein